MAARSSAREIVAIGAEDASDDAELAAARASCRDRVAGEGWPEPGGTGLGRGGDQRY